MPQDQTAPALLGFSDRRQHAVEHVLTDGVLLGLEGDDRDVVARVPHAQSLRLKDSSSGRPLLGEHWVGEILATVDGQRRARLKVARRSRIRPVASMHAARSRAIRGPLRKRNAGQRLARADIGGDRGADVPPARRLPCFERTKLPGEAPADRQVDVPRVVGNACEVIRGVVKQVAVDRP